MIQLALYMESLPFPTLKLIRRVNKNSKNSDLGLSNET